MAGFPATSKRCVHGMKTTKLKAPFKINIKGVWFWRVEAPGPNGGRIRKTFKDREDARIFYERSKVQIARFGTAAMELSDSLRVQAIEGAKKLEPYGATIAEAVEHYAKYLKSKQGGVPLTQVAEELIAEKKADELSARYRQDLRLRLGRFTKAFPEKSIREIATADVDKFLTEMGRAIGTVRTFRRDIRTLFKFAVKKGYAEKNPTDGARNPKEKAPGKIEILTVEQTHRLLSACDDATLPAVAIAVFCGLRQAELERLQWSAVDLDEKIITVDASIAKTGSRRIVDIPDNAVEWISPHAALKGAVMPSDFRRLFDRVRVRAGFKPSFAGRKDEPLQVLLTAAAKKAKGAAKKKAALAPWPANCLRHGAISYRLAQTKDIGKVSTAAGNSPTIIARHYLELVKPSAATSFFSILPAPKAQAKAVRHTKPKAK
jgi:integrase